MKYKINLKILIPLILLAIISIISIYSSLIYTSRSLGNLALKQGIWYIIGIGLVFILIKLKNDFLYQNTWILYIIGILSLIGLFFFATPINNSRCWYTIVGIGSIQPSEFMKIFIMLTLATMIHKFRNYYKNPNMLEEFIFIIKTFIVVLIPSILTFLQPDTGAVLIYLVIYFIMMFFSGIRLRWFFFLFIILICITLIFGSIYLYNEKLFIKIFSTSIYYRLERIFSWQKGLGLQLENASVSIASSGLFGHGFRKTPLYFPESSTDFIFAVFASNFGFIGIIILLSIIIYFDIQIILLMKRKINDTDKYILSGIVGMLLFQQMQNIGMNLGLLPIMGITLPFISYGGSSLLSYMLIVGIILNISKEKSKKYKYK